MRAKEWYPAIAGSDVDIDDVLDHVVAAVEQSEIVAADHSDRERVFAEPGPAVRRELPRRAVQPTNPLRGELLADVVELAVDACQPPAEALRDLLVGRERRGRPAIATQGRLGDGDDQAQL